MIFTSLKFIAFFFAAALLYFVLPLRFRWVWLLAASALFYCAAGTRCAFYILITASVVYGASLLISRMGKKRDIRLALAADKNEKKKIRKSCERKSRLVLALCLVINLGILAVLKYAGFAVNVLSGIIPSFSLAGSDFSLVAPLGISFYTFQSTGYLIDVYRETAQAQKNPLKFLLFLSFFPCIMQGPICRYNEIAPTLYEGHRFDYLRVTKGLQRMLWGFFEKLVIADRLGIAVNNVFADHTSFNGAELWVAVLMYAIQIYADFQGYMDIAIGAGEVFGVNVPENFRVPYLSRSIPEFWRRWHITLGSWFRDYLYYPVMRSRLFGIIRKKTKGKASAKVADRCMTVFALFVVWGLTGLWHGAGYTYIAWGLFHGVLIAASAIAASLFEKAVNKFRLNRDRLSYRTAVTAKTFFLVLIGYVFFRSTAIRQSFDILRSMFSLSAVRGFFTFDALRLGLDGKDLTVAVIAIIILIAVDVLHVKEVPIREKIAGQGLWFRWIIWLAGISAVVIFGVYGPEYDAASFIYFAF